MIFKDDCLEKNEQNLTLEREHASKLETEIQVYTFVSVLTCLELDEIFTVDHCVWLFY